MIVYNVLMGKMIIPHDIPPLDKTLIDAKMTGLDIRRIKNQFGVLCWTVRGIGRGFKTRWFSGSTIMDAQMNLAEHYGLKL